MPSAIERSHFVSFFQEMEIDCATYADIAAFKAHRLWERRTLVRRIRQPAFFLLLILFLPILAALHFYGWPPESFRFIAAIVGLFVASVVLGSTNNLLFERLQGEYDNLIGIASEYRILVDRAKQNMLAGRTAKVRREISESIDIFQRDRRNIDRKFAPEGADIESSRERIQQRIFLASMDTKTRIGDLDEEAESLPEVREVRRTV